MEEKLSKISTAPIGVINKDTVWTERSYLLSGAMEIPEDVLKGARKMQYYLHANGRYYFRDDHRKISFKADGITEKLVFLKEYLIKIEYLKTPVNI